jgi:hypothetical protein
VGLPLGVGDWTTAAPLTTDPEQLGSDQVGHTSANVIHATAKAAPCSADVKLPARSQCGYVQHLLHV